MLVNLLFLHHANDMVKVAFTEQQLFLPFSVNTSGLQLSPLGSDTKTATTLVCPVLTRRRSANVKNTTKTNVQKISPMLHNSDNLSKKNSDQ